MTLMDDRRIDVASPTLAADDGQPHAVAGDLTERIIAAWHDRAPLPHHFGLHTRERAPSLRTAGSH